MSIQYSACSPTDQTGPSPNVQTTWVRGRMAGVMRSACTQDVLDGQLVQVDEGVGALAGLVRVEVLEGGRVGQQVGPGLAGGDGGLSQLTDAGGGQRLLDLGVGTEGQRAFLEQQVHPHVGRRGTPDTVVAFGSRRLVVEVAGTGVLRSAVREAVLDQVDGEEGGQQ